MTLFESHGSGAEHIGSRVAQALGLPFHEQAFSSPQLEENARLREKEGLLARALSAMSHSSFGGVDVGDVAADMSIELYGWDPRDPIRYDLVLNTGRMDPETCVEIIVQASRIKGDR